eukprot:1157449-Pelagomonas_calceolata.AAC.1
MACTCVVGGDNIQSPDLLEVKTPVRKVLHVLGRTGGRVLPALQHQVIVVQPVIVLRHLALDLGGVNPGHKVLHVLGHMEGRVRHSFWAHSYMPLQAPIRTGRHLFASAELPS